ncbi:MAG: hypothetical protein Q7T11_06545 [Deltaproteobacteria bacterium]|nr:hypothetical protein [Deltaproteobacteria bacterium]
MPPTLTLTAGLDSSLSLHTRDETSDVPLSGMAYAQGILKFPTIADEIETTFKLKLMGGHDNQEAGMEGPQTLLGGALDRWIVYRNRLSPSANFGIPVMTGEAFSQTLGLKLYGGISPQEDYVYPYTFNSSWEGVPTLRYNVFDNSSGANIYTLKIGPLLGAEEVIPEKWVPPSFGKFQFNLQTGPDGGFDPNDSWATTGQAKYTKDFGDGIVTSLAFYYTTLSPESDTNANGESVSPTTGGGLFASQDFVLGGVPVGLAAGYAFKGQTIEGEGLKIDSRYKGLNVGYRLKLFDGKGILSGAYSYLGFNETTEAFVSGEESTAEHALEPINFGYAVLPGVLLGAGYALVIVDQENQTDTVVHGNEQIFYLNLSWNGSWDF